jgi:hypothetical protein
LEFSLTRNSWIQQNSAIFRQFLESTYIGQVSNSGNLKQTFSLEIQENYRVKPLYIREIFINNNKNPFTKLIFKAFELSAYQYYKDNVGTKGVHFSDFGLKKNNKLNDKINENNNENETALNSLDSLTYKSILSTEDGSYVLSKYAKSIYYYLCGYGFKSAISVLNRNDKFESHVYNTLKSTCVMNFSDAAKCNLPVTTILEREKIPGSLCCISSELFELFLEMEIKLLGNLFTDYRYMAYLGNDYIDYVIITLMSSEYIHNVFIFRTSKFIK